MYLSEYNSRLRDLDVSNLKNISDKSAKYLFKMKNLTNLNISGCTKITDKSAKEISSSNVRPKITNINISGCIGLSTNGLKLILNKCKSIRHLILDNCSQATDNLMNDILYNLKDLSYLSLCNAPNVNEDFINCLKVLYPRNLQTLVLIDNPQISLPDIRQLVETKKYNIIGSSIDITIMRNRMDLKSFTIRMNEYQRINELIEKIVERLNMEEPNRGWNAKNIRLRKVTYRKNGTKRPGNFLTFNEHFHLIREILERKHHLYLEQDINTDFFSNPREWAVTEGDIFITIRKWDIETQQPQDVGDITVNSSMSILEFKRYLCQNRIVPYHPQNILVVEEETDLRINYLVADALSLSLYGIISGDIIHVEEITPEHLDGRGHVVKSMTAEYLMKKKIFLSIQETEESFQRRKKNLGFRKELSLFKFEIPIKSTWSFFKVKKAIAKQTGIGTEFIRISTRVEPHIYLYGNTKSCIDILSGNLWLLIDINSEEMLQEKIPIWIQKYNNKCLFSECKCITVRKTTSIKLLREMIYEHFDIRDDRQILSRLTSKTALYNQAEREPKPHFLKSIYTRDDLTISEAGIRYVRVDELYREIHHNDFVLHVVQYAGEKNCGNKKLIECADFPQLFLVSSDINLYGLKRELILFLRNRSLISENCQNIYIRVENGSSLSRDALLDIKPSFFSQDSSVPISTFLSNQDLLIWSTSEF